MTAPSQQRRVRWRARVAVVAIALTLAGCAEVAVVPDRHYRLLHDAPSAQPAEPALDGTLLVKRFRADGVLAQRPIVWADASSPRELQQYHYHFWNDPPPLLVQELVVDVLRAGRAADGHLPGARFRPRCVCFAEFGVE